jgi:hypothetical protein
LYRYALGSLSEFSSMMQLLRNPPEGVEPDVKMFNHAMYALAQAPSNMTHARKGGGCTSCESSVTRPID